MYVLDPTTSLKLSLTLLLLGLINLLNNKRDVFKIFNWELSTGMRNYLKTVLSWWYIIRCMYTLKHY